jgi:hypothetical protein
LKLTDEAIEAISSLKTVKGSFSLAYLINAARGEGTLQIGVASLERWIATSEPHHDEPMRRYALRQAGRQSWPALELLVDEDWQQAAVEALELAA